MKKRILFVVNCPAFFISHRLPLALTAKQKGYEVHVATMPGPYVRQIVSLGLVHHAIPFTRAGKNPMNEIFVFFYIYKLFRQLKPTLVHLVTIKPVLYGGIAARMAGVPSVVAAVSGLGYVFIAEGAKASLMRVAVKSLYRLSFAKRNIRVIFQNQDDCSSFVESGILSYDKTILIRGSGVDLKNHPIIIEPEGKPVVTMAARLLKDKGVLEFIEAALLVKKRGIDVKFQLVGEIDPGNPASVTESELIKIKDESVVHVLGHRKNIAELFSKSNIIVLPSYREGLPKVLVEAAAAGRAVITTDVPGCRDAIEPDKSGLLVPVRNADALAEAIQVLIDDSDLRRAMGRAGRKLAEEEFSIEKITQAHLDIYKELEINA